MATKARLEISTFRPMRQRRLGEKLTDSSSGIALFSMLIRLLAKVAQTSSLLYRRFPICRRSRLEVGDTAGWKPALRRATGKQADKHASNLQQRRSYETPLQDQG